MVGAKKITLLTNKQLKYLQNKPIIPLRYFMAAGSFLLAMLILIDRACISVAKDSINKDLLLTDKQFGWVMSAFALGYAIFQMPSGLIADKLGARKMLTAVVSIWSLFTAITGMATGFLNLIFIRFIFGMGESGGFPGIAKMVYNWIPIKERGTINGINFSGGRVGTAFSLPLIAVLIDQVGWRNSFFILGAIGVLWATLWYFLYRDMPEDHPLISLDELHEIKDGQKLSPNQNTADQTPEITIRQLFKSSNMWLAMGQYFASNFVFFFCLTWLVPHLKVQYNLNTVEAGFYASIPIIAGAFGNIVSGFIVDALYKRGHLRWSRSAVAIIGFILAGSGLIASLFMIDISTAIICIAIAVFGADMTLSPSWTFCADIGKAQSGVVSGTMNMAGNLGSFVTSLAFPYLKDWTGSATPFFYVAAFLCGVAILCWTKIEPSKGV
jgi:MFS transporter, ACS family, glucarate transporter